MDNQEIEPSKSRQNKMTRRNFLRFAGAALGGGFLASCGFPPAPKETATPPSSDSNKVPVDAKGIVKHNEQVVATRAAEGTPTPPPEGDNFHEGYKKLAQAVFWLKVEPPKDYVAVGYKDNPAFKRGSAFLMERDGIVRLMTAGHNFAQHWLELKQFNITLARHKPPLEVTLGQSDIEDIINQPFSEHGPDMTQVILKPEVVKKLGKPLELADKPLNDGEIVALAGYPQVLGYSEMAEEKGEPSKVSDPFYFSKGKLRFNEPTRQWLVFSLSAEEPLGVAGGISGSPFIDQEGKVLGIATNQFCANDGLPAAVLTPPR